MKKSNIICPIYRRIGKCLAYANGRCQKLHDPRYVIVCPKHIKGLCQNEKCLLSHNVNLHKMPVCKYFLQGLCQKHRECLYLHKKLNDDTKLCTEFLKGYCPKADKVELKKVLRVFFIKFIHAKIIFYHPRTFSPIQCNLLHKFLSSENRDKKKFSIVRRKSKRETKKPEKPVEDSETVRYYIDESESAKPTGDNVPIRKKLQSLPSYIPL